MSKGSILTFKWSAIHASSRITPPPPTATPRSTRNGEIDIKSLKTKGLCVVAVVDQGSFTPLPSQYTKIHFA